MTGNGHVLALCGGVGGAKLALGLTRILPASDLTIAVNTGDDFEHFGLTICPDLDTVSYTLSGLNNPTLGWGRGDESWAAMDVLNTLGAETWFQLGDRDLALHLARRQWLDEGLSLSEVTARINRQLGIKHTVTPMSDDAVRTHVHTDRGTLSFQHYFVRDRCEPEVTGFEFRGADQARPAPRLEDTLDRPDLDLILLCPSNPFVSMAPLLAIPGLQDRFRASTAPVIAVSPIIAGQAVKGPAAKMMTELGLPLSALGVFEYYGHLLDGFVMDEQDLDLFSGQGDPQRFHACQTLMKTLEDREDLARECLAFGKTLRKQANEA